MNMCDKSLHTIIILAVCRLFCAGAALPCWTPNGENATCVSLSSCTIIMNAVLSLNESNLAFAKSSQCSYDSEPMVCCGSSATFTFNDGPLESNLLPGKDTCGFSIMEDKIFGGVITDIGEFPWMALVSYINPDNSSAGFKCGGTLINDRYVLTAAHCLQINSALGFSPHVVRLGEWRISSEIDCNEELIIRECSDPVVDVKIEKSIVHSKYNRKSGDNDIGLVRLEKPVAYTDYIRPICLPSFNSPVPKPGAIFVVSGWGSTELGSSSDVKLKLNIPIVSNDDCLAKIKDRGTVSERQVCAGGEQLKDACSGDSGGPLMAQYRQMGYAMTQWYQEGIIAWGIGCGKLNFPAVYTRVEKYLGWILDNIADS